MLYDLLKVYAATHCSNMLGSARMVWCRPDQTMWQYGSSLNRATSRPRIRSARPRRSSAVATPPVGLWGEFRKIALGCFADFRKRSTAFRSGRNSVSARRGAYTGNAPRRAMFGS
jgi:hypothetical protein